MTLNGVMALNLRYFTELVYDVVVKKFTFAIWYPDEFFVYLRCIRYTGHNMHCYEDSMEKFLHCG